MLEDKWFHTRVPMGEEDAGEVKYQGRVLGYQPPRLVLVQLFSWITGTPTDQKLLEVTEDWDFYDTSDDMNAAYDATMVNQRLYSLPGYDDL